jgi:hypothetical protein
VEKFIGHGAEFDFNSADSLRFSSGWFLMDLIAYFCARYNLYEFLLKHYSNSNAAVGALCGLSLLVEAPRRRAELAMYVMPKALESAWVSASGREWVAEGERAGESLVGMGYGESRFTYCG